MAPCLEKFTESLAAEKRESVEFLSVLVNNDDIFLKIFAKSIVNILIFDRIRYNRVVLQAIILNLKPPLEELW